jgi:hypothetical protein
MRQVRQEDFVYAADLASFLTQLRRTSEAKADRVGRTLSSSKSFERS